MISRIWIFTGNIMLYIYNMLHKMLYICNNFRSKPMKPKIQKFLLYLSLLSLLALLTPITGNPKWKIFTVFLCFMVFTKVKVDERLKSNLNKAARNGFISSIACIVGLAYLLTRQLAVESLMLAVQVCLWIMILVFAASFTLFDKKGI